MDILEPTATPSVLNDFGDQTARRCACVTQMAAVQTRRENAPATPTAGDPPATNCAFATTGNATRTRASASVTPTVGEPPAPTSATAAPTPSATRRRASASASPVGGVGRATASAPATTRRATRCRGGASARRSSGDQGASGASASMGSATPSMDPAAAIQATGASTARNPAPPDPMAMDAEGGAASARITTRVLSPMAAARPASQDGTEPDVIRYVLPVSTGTGAGSSAPVARMGTPVTTSMGGASIVTRAGSEHSAR